MARNLDKLAIPGPEEDEMLAMEDEEMLEDDFEDEAPEGIDLTGEADEDLVEELESRGYVIEAPAEEADAEASEDTMDEELSY